MVLDAASRSCIVIDPLPDHVARIEAYVRCQNYQVQAIVSTLPNAGRTMLIDALGRHFDRHAQADEYGWPADGTTVTLENGASVGAIRIGTQVLANMACGAGDELRAYLLGAADGERLPAASVRFAFSARPARQALGAVGAEQTLLCPTRDEHNQFCTSLTTQAAATPSAELQLDGAGLDAFLQAHPDAVLIDVREPYEFAATITPGPAGRVAQSVPLNRLAEYAAEWLRGEPAPLVFFCRSGNRSIKAAQCLRRLGHPQAYSLTGGLALAPLPLAA
jgi:rhodanese-related sulfurtransferase